MANRTAEQTSNARMTFRKIWNEQEFLHILRSCEKNREQNSHKWRNNLTRWITMKAHEVTRNIERDTWVSATRQWCATAERGKGRKEISRVERTHRLSSDLAYFPPLTAPASILPSPVYHLLHNRIWFRTRCLLLLRSWALSHFYAKAPTSISFFDVNRSGRKKTQNKYKPDNHSPIENKFHWFRFNRKGNRKPMYKALVISFNLKLLFGFHGFFGLHAIFRALIILPNLTFNLTREVLKSLVNFIEWNLIKFLQAFTVFIDGICVTIKLANGFILNI